MFQLMNCLHIKREATLTFIIAVAVHLLESLLIVSIHKKSNDIIDID